MAEPNLSGQRRTSRAASPTASARGWASFTNGGAATYGFYDEQWKPVVKDGKHGQLIEINTWGLAASDPNRYAGIYQVVGGLKKGAVYEFSMWGLMREEAAHPDEDPSSSGCAVPLRASDPRAKTHR